MSEIHDKVRDEATELYRDLNAAASRLNAYAVAWGLPGVDLCAALEPFSDLARDLTNLPSQTGVEGK